MGTLLHSARIGWRGLRHFLKQGRIDPLPVRHAFSDMDVALGGLPQGMAFAAMAGLDSIYGIMAATVGTFLAPLFTRCSLTVSGPSNATAFMLASFMMAASPVVQSSPHIFVPLIVFIAGLLCV